MDLLFVAKIDSPIKSANDEGEAHALSCPIRATKDIKEIAFLTITSDMSHKDSLYKNGKQ